MRLLLDKFSRFKLKQRNKDVQHELALDLEILEKIAKEIEAEKEQRELAKVQERQRLQKYLGYLREQREIEKQHEIEIEKILQQDMERAWAEKEKVRVAEQAARDRLMTEVLKSRDEQLQRKRKSNPLIKTKTILLTLRIGVDNLRRQEEIKREQERIQQHLEDLRRKDEQKAEKHKVESAEYHRLLRFQIEDVRERRRREEERIQREIDAIKAQQQAYTDRIKTELEHVGSQRDFRIRKSEF